jgi:hypothetical protein
MRADTYRARRLQQRTDLVPPEVVHRCVALIRGDVTWRVTAPQLSVPEVSIRHGCLLLVESVRRRSVGDLRSVQRPRLVQTVDRYFWRFLMLTMQQGELAPAAVRSGGRVAA